MVYRLHASEKSATTRKRLAAKQENMAIITLVCRSARTLVMLSCAGALHTWVREDYPIAMQQLLERKLLTRLYRLYCNMGRALFIKCGALQLRRTRLFAP